MNLEGKDLKDLLRFDDTFDKQMTETVEVVVDDKGSKKNKVTWSDCGCNGWFKKGIVLDPFFGSGTTGIEALRQGKNFVGIELNSDYCKMAQEELENEMQKNYLF